MPFVGEEVAVEVTPLCELRGAGCSPSLTLHGVRRFIWLRTRRIRAAATPASGVVGFLNISAAATEGAASEDSC